MSAPCPHNFKGASCCECPLDCACRRFALVAGKCAVGIPIAPQVGDASGIEAYSEPPAPDDNLPKAGTDLFVGHEFSGAGLKNPCLVCGGSFFARQHRLRIDTCVACRNPIIDGVDHPECIAKLSAKEQEERARLVGGSRTPNTPEPAPKPGVARATWSLVMADMLERDAAGAAKYGIRHQHDNGRDHLVDAYQEALDLALYLRAEIEKRKGNLVGGAQ